MKKLFLLMLSLGIIACTTSRDNFVNPYPNIETIQDLPKEHRFKPKSCSSHLPKNGSIDEIVSNGRRIKSKTKNHCIDEEVFIYHPNGQLHSNTPLVDGLADGWSNGYTENGILRTKILYQKGYTILIQVYNNDGQIVKEIK
ncbi:Uncharacterised protein [Canicola haemoglobinophilus]|uniref:Lipoprotein n=1 Tax=Canicola haemoglobinophilus TaxID=733 RepID=A0AB38H9X4_9PAST|nr:hypothetical protein [Canicola haemoglobinophilus]STO55280.1 Uncharacterised protein [Canicola haemoglobinophilus]STO69150.1 Uncharacterised protein [Canicola haemoglobinophilus]